MKTYAKEKLNHSRGGNWNVRALKDLPYDEKLTLKQIVKHMVCFTTFYNEHRGARAQHAGSFINYKGVQSPVGATHMRDYRHCIEDAYFFLPLVRLFFSLTRLFIFGATFFFWCPFFFSGATFIFNATNFQSGAIFFPLGAIFFLFSISFVVRF